VRVSKACALGLYRGLEYRCDGTRPSFLGRRGTGLGGSTVTIFPGRSPKANVVGLLAEP
jgi:hypothetical protein